MNKKIIAITGLSGTGKTSILNKFVELHPEYKRAVCYTTRPKREGEIDGLDYIFTTNDVYCSTYGFNIKLSDSFKVANGDIWYYGYTVEQLNDDNNIFILTPAQVDELKEIGYDVHDYCIVVNDVTRLKRIYDRADNQGTEEIKRRNIADKATYANYKPMSYIYNTDIEIAANNLQFLISVAEI